MPDIIETTHNVVIADDLSISTAEVPVDLTKLGLSLFNPYSNCCLCSIVDITVFTGGVRTYLIPKQYNIRKQEISKYDIRNWVVKESQLEVREMLDSMGKIINNTYKISDNDNPITRVTKEALNSTSGIRVHLPQLAIIKKSTEQLRKVKSTVSANKVLSFIEDLGNSGLAYMTIEFNVKDANGKIVTKSVTIGEIR